ncbi:hypothetical protein [Cellulosimicrobium sp. CUA-896]|uniref:hypothetical protein n=1 Tax=Cellulosimicrobium sp. CUA-896 TaxID=1517881 RepID=UPI000A85E76D|nr:hypothetical protein [Cellulosimicrobium sp. CUA-896]
MTRPVAPEAPGRLGEAIPAADLMRYLGELESWLDARRTELDRLDAAAQAAAAPDAYTADLVLALSLWQAIRGRADDLRETWDSGRVDVVAREKMSVLIWGRLDSGSGAALVSLVEAATLCDALVVQLRTRLSFDPHTADQVARLRGVRAELVRCEDLAGSDVDARAASSPCASGSSGSWAGPSAAPTWRVPSRSSSRTSRAPSATSSWRPPSAASWPATAPGRPSAATPSRRASPRCASSCCAAAGRSSMRRASPCPTSRVSARCPSPASSSTPTPHASTPSSAP